MGVYARLRVLVERARRNRSSAGQAIFGRFAPDLGTPRVVDALRVVAAMWTVARGGTHVALVVSGPP
jgi:hypothetical protein